MNEKIYAVKNHLMNNKFVALSKQCKKEFIVYCFYLDATGNMIHLQKKTHYANRDLSGGKNRKLRRVEISLRDFLDNTVYDLINRGYELDTLD